MSKAQTRSWFQRGVCVCLAALITGLPLAASALAITVTNATGWTTGPVTVTGITSFPPGDPTPVNTVTTTGFDARTAGHAGTISLVSPTRVLTNAAGNLPLFARLQISGVNLKTPEPGTALLLLAAVGGCVQMGRTRLRR